ncbi:hypothetical protein LEMLEM_LOCUS5807 [Lemmus lemmus]
MTVRKQGEQQNGPDAWSWKDQGGGAEEDGKSSCGRKSDFQKRKDLRWPALVISLCSSLSWNSLWRPR